MFVTKRFINMYAVRSSWAGQAFAIATPNDSGGKKSRIRRSKDDRKAMVESFIKRYQSLNKGNFPSLRLTHKEVGGSYYIVREVFREIIQENKVLGPARNEVQTDNTIKEPYLLGSVRRKSQDLLFQTESELNVDYNQEGKETVEWSSDGNGHYTNHLDLDSVQLSSEHQIDESDELACTELASEDHVISSHKEHVNSESSLSSNELCLNENETDCGQLVNGLQTNEISEESDKLLAEVKEHLEAGSGSELEEACKATLTLPTEAIAVETFPLKPGTTSTDLANLNGSLNHLGTKQVEESNVNPVINTMSSSDKQSHFVTGKGANVSESSTSDRDPNMVVQHGEVNGVVSQDLGVDLTSTGFEVPDSSTIKQDNPILSRDPVNHIASDGNLTLKTAKQSTEQVGVQSNTAPKGTAFAETCSATSSKYTGKEPVANRNNNQRDEKAIKGSSPTFDRTKLETWEGTSKRETNPILAFCQAFVGVLSKYWPK